MEGLPRGLEPEEIKKQAPETEIQRIVGDIPSDIARNILTGHRLRMAIVRYPETNEREKTSEELSMISRAAQYVNNVRSRDGLPPANISPNDVGIFESKNVVMGGDYNPYDQKVRHEIGPSIPAAVVFNNIQHELFHKGTYQALQVCTGVGVRSYRMGLKVEENIKKAAARDPNMPGLQYVLPLNEALTEEHARRSLNSIEIRDPDLGHIAQERGKEFAELTAIVGPDVIPREEFLGFRDQSVMTSGYPEERRIMWKLFDKIAEKLPDRFVTPQDAREQIFEIVTKSATTGNLLPLGRLMRDAFGENAFRRYGHLQTPQQIDEFIAAQ